jgi:hypothetical protein
MAAYPIDPVTFKKAIVEPAKEEQSRAGPNIDGAVEIINNATPITGLAGSKVSLLL